MVIGNLCGNDLIMAEHLARNGLNPLVVRHYGDSSMGVPDSYLDSLNKKNIVYLRNSFEFLRYARQCRLIFSITGALIFHLGHLWNFRFLYNLPPIINLSTGSDMTERLAEKSRVGIYYRQYVRFVDLNWCLPMPHTLKHIVQYRVPNVIFMNGFPYLVPNLSYSLSAKADKKENNSLRLFHCSHIDWNYSNFGVNRNSTKGNDKFIRAYIRAVKAGYNIKLTILERGPDKLVAKEMCDRAGISEYITWKSDLSRDELYEEILKSHVVVNMFAHGGAGGISYEAMALGRPVMQYANPDYFKLMYSGNIPPFINCRTEDEIYEKIIWCCQSDQLTSIGVDSSKWVTKYIDPENSLTGFLFYYTLLTGDKKNDFGPHIEDMEKHVKEVSSGKYDPFENLVS